MLILSLIFGFLLNSSSAAEPRVKYLCDNSNYSLSVRDFNDTKNTLPTTKLLVFTKKNDKDKNGKSRIAYCLGKDNPYLDIVTNDHDCTPSRSLLTDEKIKLSYIRIIITADGKHSELTFEEVGKSEVRSELNCELQKKSV